jgi:hypothetical protein
MSNKHRHIGEHFPGSDRQQPALREVESLLHHLGAGNGHGAIFHVRLKRHEFTIHHPHHGAPWAGWTSSTCANSGGRRHAVGLRLTRGRDACVGRIDADYRVAPVRRGQ